MEVQVLRTVGNFPFIATFAFACQTSTRLYVGMEFCAAGDFFSYMSQSHIRHDDIPLYVGEIALALDHLHSHGILFRDLKPENITLSARGHVRLIDFGLSVFLDSEEAQTSANGRREVVTSCGTLTYTAPEVLCRTPHSYESDWWSLGILAYELYTGFMPFEGATDQETCDLICTVDFDPCPPVVEGRPEYDLIRRLLVRAQDLRLGYRRSDVRIVLSHAVFAGIDWDDLLHERISPRHPFGNQSSLSLAHFGDEFTTQTPIDRPLAPASAPQHVFDTELYPVITDTQLRSTR
ncbi:Protein kinase, putative [Hondaea fermentalgiana]|uniref:non-specific serine/threonine protein kinase n=1 Tax=Hondaea fermentalgiana TaxID=2315210 RepID=A0A2R5FZL3_9STRA|nr:Protein kinase, putative [Hondaea fermentalgiana]|eukprot:GBG24192.1 Protein kinase, putative [Hondaea fermentalgiana]